MAGEEGKKAGKVKAFRFKLQILIANKRHNHRRLEKFSSSKGSEEKGKSEKEGVGFKTPRGSDKSSSIGCRLRPGGKTKQNKGKNLNQMGGKGEV